MLPNVISQLFPKSIFRDTCKLPLPLIPNWDVPVARTKYGDNGGVSEDVLCAGNDQVLKFLEDVYSELIEIFPSEYIHVGGDECPKVRWEKCPKCQARIKALGLKSDDKHSKEERLQSFVINHIENSSTTTDVRSSVGMKSSKADLLLTLLLCHGVVKRVVSKQPSRNTMLS